jgi:hypothetical protein
MSAEGAAGGFSQIEKRSGQKPRFLPVIEPDVR